MNDERGYELSDEALEELESDVMSASASIAQVHAERNAAEERADYLLSQLDQADSRVKARYGRWLVNADQELQDQLALLAEDPQGLARGFEGQLELCEGVLDAPWGPGPALLNRHTLGAFAQALGQYLLIACNDPSVILAGERGEADLPLCRVVAEVLASFGVVTYLAAYAQEASAVAELVVGKHADAGICLTASPEGACGPVKVLGCDGEPLCEAACKQINASLRDVDMFDDIRRFDLRKALREGLVIPLDKGKSS
ncbi:MAG: hypothetical protein ACI4VV_03240 [Eggerthellaceae bacterium]